MRSRLNEWGVERVVTRPLGVDIETFTPARRAPALRRELGLQPRTRLLAYAGRFSPEKNIDVLLDAFRFPGRRLSSRPRRTPRDLPLPANVTPLPFVHSPRALARILASVDGLVHAGDQETFGLVLLEAMACGRGVIAAKAGAIPEIVTPQTGILVPPGDAQALAAGIQAFYRRGPGEFGREARARVERAYGWDTAMRGLLGLYRGALSAASCPAPRYATP